MMKLLVMLLLSSQLHAYDILVEPNPYSDVHEDELMLYEYDTEPETTVEVWTMIDGRLFYQEMSGDLDCYSPWYKYGC